MSTRSSILRQLRSADDWITGDLLSRDLGISRAAVSKQVRALRDSGYSITTVPNRGYRFESAPDLLLADEILPLTTCRTFGKARYTHFHSVGATNAQAHGLAEDGCPEGTVVVAEEQTEGKGRKGPMRPPGASERERKLQSERDTFKRKLDQLESPNGWQGSWGNSKGSWNSGGGGGSWKKGGGKKRR